MVGSSGEAPLEERLIARVVRPAHLGSPDVIRLREAVCELVARSSEARQVVERLVALPVVTAETPAKLRDEMAATEIGLRTQLGSMLGEAPEPFHMLQSPPAWGNISQVRAAELLRRGRLRQLGQLARGVLAARRSSKW